MDQKDTIKEDEIDLIELVKVVWSRRWFIAKVTGVFVALGLLIAFTSPKEYETSCTLIPEAMGGDGNLGGSLGGLASLAGINLGGLPGGVGGSINPGLYRSVARSTPFLISLMNEEFYFTKLDQNVSLYRYFVEYAESGLFSGIMGLPYKIIALFKSGEVHSPVEGDSKIITLTKYQQLVIENLKNRILVTMDWDLNLVSIEVEMQDPIVAAQIAQYTQDYITNYVTNYSVSKSQEQLNFILDQFEMRKKEFEDIQLKLADFRDRNQNVNTAKAKSEEEILQSRYNLAFNVYNQLAQKLETIRLQINEDTPVFTVLEPVQVPVERSSPKRLVTLIVFTFLGVLIGFMIVFMKTRSALILK